MNEQRPTNEAKAPEESLRPSVADEPALINGKLCAFERTELFDGKLSALLPSEFTDLPAEIAKIKYPSSDRPKIIKTDERGTVAFTFNRIDSPLTNETVPELVESMRGMLQKLNPAYVFFDSDTLDTEEGAKVGYLEYKSPAIDDSLYNVMHFVPFEGRTMMGTFSCPHGECEDWRSPVAETLRSIRASEKEGEEDA
jgi:hypothetical protein